MSKFSRLDFRIFIVAWGISYLFFSWWQNGSVIMHAINTLHTTIGAILTIPLSHKHKLLYYLLVAIQVMSFPVVLKYYTLPSQEAPPWVIFLSILPALSVSVTYVVKRKGM